MKSPLLIACLLLFSTALAFPPLSAKKHVLIYTRNGEGYVHDNISASVEALGEICQQNNIDYDSSDDPALFTAENLRKYDAIIFSNTNNEAFTTQAQRDAFQHFIQAGGGFMGLHSATASERDWPWFHAMIGGLFVRHPELQPFDIKVIDTNHLSTQHLGDVWAWEDECYFMDHLNLDIHVLLAVDLTTLDDPEREKYPGTTFGDLFPLCWVHEYDGGRQFYTALGHKIEHYKDPDFSQHLQGGLLWVLGKR